MAYLRWGDSHWYIYWESTRASRKEDELLAIWHTYASYKELGECKFKYEELKRIGCMEELKHFLANKLSKSTFKRITKKDWEELWQAIRLWIEDVNGWWEGKKE